MYEFKYSFEKTVINHKINKKNLIKNKMLFNHYKQKRNKIKNG